MERRKIDEKVERSIPVQSRVDITTLADMAVYLEGKGFRVTTMSMLVSYSMEIARKALEDNELLERVHADTADAHMTLQLMRLYQRSMFKRARTKINRSMGFDELRKEGINPAHYAPDEYDRVHNDHSVDPFNPPVLASKKTEELVELYEKLKREEFDKNSERKEIDLDSLMRKEEDDEGGVDESEIVKVDRKIVGRNACVVDEEVIAGKVNSDVPKQKTDEEMKEDEKRIEDKDRELMKELDKMGGPSS